MDLAGVPGSTYRINISDSDSVIHCGACFHARHCLFAPSPRVTTRQVDGLTGLYKIAPASLGSFPREQVNWL